MNKQPVPIDHSGVWRGEQFSDKSAITYSLTRAQLYALEQALAAVKHKHLHTITRADFALAPDIAEQFYAIRDEILHGRGVVIMRGFPVDRYDDAEMTRLFWGLGLYFGHAVSQSLMGDRVGFVTDVSGVDPKERGYRSRAELDFHTDSDDIVGLLCLRQAESGGLSRLVSALTVHNDMLAQRPELLEPLYRGFYYHWRGEQPPDEGPITDYRVPVFSRCQDQLSCVLLRNQIELAANELGQPLTDFEQAALEMVRYLAGREDNVLEFTLEPGEASFINNYTVLHSRTAFVDHAESARKRCLLRLWLKAPNGGRPVVEPIRRFYRPDGITPRAGGTTLFDAAARR